MESKRSNEPKSLFVTVTFSLALLWTGCGPAADAGTAKVVAPAQPAAGPVESAPASPASSAGPCDPNNMTECKDRCAKGDEASCFRAATILQRGSRIGGPEESEYVSVYQRTCDGKSPNAPEACGRLAYILFMSPNIKNEVRAFEYGKKGCELGSPVACVFLAREHKESGWAARSSNFERACSLGEKAACVEGGVLAVEGREGLPPDTAKGLKMLDGACSAGEAAACAHLAFLYDRGSVRGGKATEVKPDAAKWEAYKRKYCDLKATGHGMKCP